MVSAGWLYNLILQQTIILLTVLKVMAELFQGMVVFMRFGTAVLFLWANGKIRVENQPHLILKLNPEIVGVIVHKKYY